MVNRMASRQGTRNAAGSVQGPYVAGVAGSGGWTQPMLRLPNPYRAHPPVRLGGGGGTGGGGGGEGGGGAGGGTTVASAMVEAAAWARIESM